MLLRAKKIGENASSNSMMTSGYRGSLYSVRRRATRERFLALFCIASLAMVRNRRLSRRMGRMTGRAVVTTHLEMCWVFDTWHWYRNTRSVCTLRLTPCTLYFGVWLGQTSASGQGLELPSSFSFFVFLLPAPLFLISTYLPPFLLSTLFPFSTPFSSWTVWVSCGCACSSVRLSGVSCSSILDRLTDISDHFSLGFM